MAKYLKPQTPLQHQSGDYIYPITTVDQIITANGERLNSKIVVVDTENVNIGKPNPVNADTLGGSSLDDVKIYVNNQITNRVIHSGGKNLLKNTAKSQTINGITFTVNNDGSITANGTCSKDIGIEFGKIEYNKVKGCIVTGCPSGSGAGKHITVIRYLASDGSIVKTEYERGSGWTIDPNVAGVSHISLLAYIYGGYTANNITFYPMIRLASETDDTYEPYYEGLKELTYRGADLVWKNASSGSEFNAQSIPLDLSKYYKVEVEFKCANSSDIRVIFPAITGSGRYNCVSDDNRGKLATRIMRAYSDKLSFNSGYIYSTYGTYTEDDNVMIPLKIYGIKEEFYDCIES